MAKRRRRRGIGGIIAVFVIMLLIMSVGAYFFLTKEERLAKSTRWMRQVDVTADVRESIRQWVNMARLGDEIPVDEMVPTLTYNVILDFKGAGNYEESLDEASYEKCVNEAYEAFKAVALALLDKRLEVSGNGDVGETEDLVKEAIGMDIDTYLKEYGPKIIDTLDETKEATAFAGNTQTYLCNNDTLVITLSEGEPVLYERWEEK
ncbi:MAG: hypothetical protein IKY04_04385 [Lachnospiraceae bacterium]|nr:hypothetical protein [Lachnospiraceae bacterium]